MIPLFGDTRTDGGWWRQTFARPDDDGSLARALRAQAIPGSMIGFGVDSPDDVAAQSGLADIARVGRASYRAQVLIENTYAREAAIEEAAERRIRAIRQATGATLVNPTLQVPGGTMDGFLPPGTVEPPPNPLDEFDRRRTELAASFPDKADAIRADLTLADEARSLAREAMTDLARISGEVGGAGAAIGGFAGAVGGMFRDPLQVSLLFAGGGAGTAATVLGRVAQVAAREALISAGGAALSQPSVQAWRAEIGAESGVVPALENVALAALFGGVLGGGVEGVREGFKALRAADRAAVERTLAGEATPAEAERALRLVGADPEVAAELRIAADADAYEAAVPAPRGVPDAVDGEARAQALRRAESGDPLPPEPVLPVRAGVTDDAAIAVLERDDLDAIGALRALRDDPDLIESALSSGSPAVREAGHVALLGDEAFAFVADGRVEPRHAALALRTGAEPDLQAAVMADLARAAPTSLAAAREVVGDALSARTARAHAARAMRTQAYEPAAAPELPPLPPALATRPGDDLLMLTPGVDASGRDALVPRGSFELAGTRERFLNELVSACNA